MDNAYGPFDIGEVHNSKVLAPFFIGMHQAMLAFDEDSSVSLSIGLFLQKSAVPPADLGNSEKILSGRELCDAEEEFVWYIVEHGVVNSNCRWFRRAMQGT